MSRIGGVLALGLLAAAGGAVYGSGAVAQQDPADGSAAEIPARPVPLDPSPSSCAQCHAEIVAAWRGSLHAQAWTDPVFRAEYDPAPAVSCRGCHDPAGAGEGVDCATCHLQEGQILATRASAEGRAAHPVRIDPKVGAVDRCGRCHQFHHADDGIHDPTELLQATVDEWRATEAAQLGRGCVDCHMPADDGPGHGHALPGLGDPQLMASAVEVEVQVQRTPEGVAVDVEITGADIGHAFPTGDVFRRGVLTLTTPGGAEARVEMQRWLARTVDPDGADTHLRTVDDTRVPPPGAGSVRERVMLADPDAREVRWALEVRRLDLALADARGLPRQMVVIPVEAGVVAVADP